MRKEKASRLGARFYLLALPIAAVAVTAFPFIASSQQNVGPQRSTSDQSIRVRSEEVVVDATVTDRNGKPVVNLAPADFEIYEDGIKQQIRSFRLESRSRAASTESWKDNLLPRSASAVTSRKQRLVSLVFDTTGTARDGALMARRAAQEYVRDQMEDESFVAVYGTGISMHIFQPFTKDRAALLKAIEEVTSGDMQRFGSISSEIRAQLESIVGRWSDAEKMTAAYGDATSYISRTASQEAEGEKVADARSSPTTPDLNSLALASLRTLLVFHLLVYFTVYPAQPSHAAVEAILEFVQNGKPQARAQGTLPAADANGRVQYVTTVGLENFEPGEYSLRVTVKDGRDSASAQSSFRVEP